MLRPMNSLQRVMRVRNNAPLFDAWIELEFVAEKNFGRSDTASIQGGVHSGLEAQNTGKAGSVRKLNLDVSSIAGVPVDAKHLDRLAGKLWALDIVVLHESSSISLDSRARSMAVRRAIPQFYPVPVSGA